MTMPDDIDTSALRAKWQHQAAYAVYGAVLYDMGALCDALDAARADATRVADAVAAHSSEWDAATTRAERMTEWWRQQRNERMAAEARNERLAETIAFERQANERNCSELLAAEARIAAGLDCLARSALDDVRADVRRALTGDTE